MSVSQPPPSPSEKARVENYFCSACRDDCYRHGSVAISAGRRCCSYYRRTHVHLCGWHSGNSHTKLQARWRYQIDRKRGVKGKRGAVRGDMGGRRSIKKKK